MLPQATENAVAVCVLWPAGRHFPPLL